MNVDLEQVIRELAPNLLRYCTARTGDRSLAEEIAQDSLAALVQRWNRRGPPDCPEAFAFAIARRRAARRLLGRRLWQPLTFLRDRRDHAPDPEAIALGRSECAAVVRALEQLPVSDREVLNVVVLGGLKTPAAARALGNSESAVKMRTMRARRRLRTLMENGHARNR
jgi:RNA polymerase sigma-70 factor (ECF subfamily)